MRVLFLGSSEFSIPSLEALLGSSHDVMAVYTKVPRPAGRGKQLTKTPVHAYADSKGIPVRCPVSLNSLTEQEALNLYLPDAMVVVSYGLILPRWMLSAARFGCINIHPSLLPKWRGAAPMQHTILAGDKVTGVTVMRINEFMDAGDIFSQESTHIGEQENICELSERLSKVGARMLLEVLDNIGNIQPVKQDDESATFAPKPTEFQIEFHNTADYICRQIRALYPKAFFIMGDRRIRVLAADSYEFSEGEPGDVLNDKMHIKCGGNTVLVPTVVQLESRSPCNINGFLCGLRGNVPNKL